VYNAAAGYVMDLNLVVETPEQIGIDFEIAGIGSRMLAAIIDALIMSILLIVATVAPFLLIASAREAAGTMAENLAQQEHIFRNVNALGLAVVFLSYFAVQWGYYIVAELLTDGRSPGKRALGLRVVRADGFPIGFAETVVRNLVRIVDIVPGVYGIGLVTMMSGRKTQRLGDVAAGTIVIKERVGQQKGTIEAIPMPSEQKPMIETRVSAALTPAELTLLASYRNRAAALTPHVRAILASQIAPILRARLSDASTLDDESWLWALAHEAEGGPRV
jgi:uncharacterized RDD family membrane protein YckC